MDTLRERSKFYRDLESFSDEFYHDVTMTATPGSTCDDIVLRVGQPMLLGYTHLLECYRSHGLYHDMPYEKQPTSARLGRKVAGTMWNIAKGVLADMDDRMNDTNERKEKEQTTSGRFISASPLYHPQSVDDGNGEGTVFLSDILAEAIQKVTPGVAIDLEYETEDMARKDQVLIPTATKKQGWYHGIKCGMRPFKSRIRENDSGTYTLTIIHLDTPVPERGTA